MYSFGQLETCTRFPTARFLCEQGQKVTGPQMLSFLHVFYAATVFILMISASQTINYLDMRYGRTIG